jgi:tetratricopeptide (TPR) repeat protein
VRQEDADSDYLFADILQRSAFRSIKQNQQSSASTSESTANLNADPEFYTKRGWKFYEIKQYDKAISDFTHVINSSPEYAVAYYNRGLAYRELGNTAKVKADLDKAKELGYTDLR